jgi:hypothetical protein
MNGMEWMDEYLRKKAFYLVYFPTGTVSFLDLQQPTLEPPFHPSWFCVPGLQVGRIPLLSASDVSPGQFNLHELHGWL